MKKVLLSIAVLSVALSFIGCSNKNNVNTNTDSIPVMSELEENKSNEKELEEPTEVEVDEKSNEENKLTTVKIISTEVSEPIGDRTVDNYVDENGEYFAIGSDIVKCSDYDNIHVVAELTNNRDVLLNTSATAWSAKMEDGYELELSQDGNTVGPMNDGDLGKQIQSGSTVTVEFDILKEKSVKGNKVLLKYWDVDFGESFGEFMSAAMSGTSEEDCKKEFPQYFDEKLYYTFEIEVN